MVLRALVCGPPAFALCTLKSIEQRIQVSSSLNSSFLFPLDVETRSSVLVGVLGRLDSGFSLALGFERWFRLRGVGFLSGSRLWSLGVRWGV